MFGWTQKTGVGLHLVPPGKPNDNVFIESLNATMRDECLNESQFSTLKEAQEIIENFCYV